MSQSIQSESTTLIVEEQLKQKLIQYQWLQWLVQICTKSLTFESQGTEVLTELRAHCCCVSRRESSRWNMTNTYQYMWPSPIGVTMSVAMFYLCLTVAHILIDVSIRNKQGNRRNRCAGIVLKMCPELLQKLRAAFSETFLSMQL